MVYFRIVCLWSLSLGSNFIVFLRILIGVSQLLLYLKFLMRVYIFHKLTFTIFSFFFFLKSYNGRLSMNFLNLVKIVCPINCTP